MSALRRPLGLALGGVAALAVPAWLFRVDRLSCAAWPPLGRWLVAAAAFALALGLLAAAWLGLEARLAAGRGPSARQVLAGGALLHLLAATLPSFLIQDPLLYAAVGHAQAAYGASAYVPVSHTLPADAPFFRALPEDWRDGSSAYLPGWNALARAIGHVGGARLGLHLKLHQLVALVAVLLSALLCAAAARRAAAGEGDALAWPGGAGPPDRAAARAAGLVLFSPLALVEATVNAHNDALLLLGVALAVYALQRGTRLLALVGLASGLLVKASALLALGHFVLAELAALVRRRRAVGLALGAALLLAVGLLFAVDPTAWKRYSMTTARLLGVAGAGATPFLFCTRAVECAPRALLHYVLGLPAAAAWVGLGFRALSAGFLFVTAVAAAPGRWLRAGASALFLFYLLLNGFSQTWYWLPLLALLPYAPAGQQRALRLFLWLPLAYYLFELPTQCSQSVVVVGAVELVEAVLVVIPPVWLLWRDRQPARR